MEPSRASAGETVRRTGWGAGSARRSAWLAALVWAFTCQLLLVGLSLGLQDTATGQRRSTQVNNNAHNRHKQLSEAKALAAQEALQLVGQWANRFGRDIHLCTVETTCLRSLSKQFDPARPAEPRPTIESINWPQELSDIVKTINTTMGWHQQAVGIVSRRAEELAKEHVFNQSLRFDYIDAHKLEEAQESDEATTSPYPSEDQQPNLTGVSSEDEAAKQASGGLDPPANSPDTDTLASLGQHVQPEGPPPDQPTFSRQLANPPNEVPPPQESSQPLEGGPATAENRPSNDTAQYQQTWQQPAQLAIGQSVLTPIDLANLSKADWQPSTRQLKLKKHKNFGDILINTDESIVHVPVHIYAGEPEVMNGIAWSDGLTQVFRANFVRNQKLTNQYFASQTGFLRLYPAQKWQVARTDPDLYYAPMRPFYVNSASSRKDVVILVDSSGSMTGSRRDIARGVTFEILDTLTDNDHFMILKFSDTVQQVGVPNCQRMQVGERTSGVPAKNTLSSPNRYNDLLKRLPGSLNETDIDSLYLVPANGRNIRHVKANFTIPTSGIANFSHALITAFEVLRNYRESVNQMGSQCNQAIMLITDGSPSDFSDIFNAYNVPNAPVRVFTYLIGREAGDVTHTKMMACRNRGFYTHVINLAEARESVQQYIPVMARPLVLNGTHPVIWTPAYGDLTYQVLNDWVWEAKRREKARAILAAYNLARSGGAGAGDTSSPASNAAGDPSPGGGAGFVSDIRVVNDDLGSSYGPGLDEHDGDANLDEILGSLDLFGYNADPDCFWQTRRNDLLTTVVQPVYDPHNASKVAEKFLLKNSWNLKETLMRTANLLGVAAADMKINDIIDLAASHKLGSNAYAIMLTNNGYAMHHPDLRSVLEPLSSDPNERKLRILKPFFSSIDLTQLEHVFGLNAEEKLANLRHEAVWGHTGLKELQTKRAFDCHRRVQTRQQNFYYHPIPLFPFSFIIAVPQPYGAYRLEGQVEVKSSHLPEKLTNYFTTSDYDMWTVHPDYHYCDGPSSNEASTLLDVFQRIENNRLDEILWQADKSESPPFTPPGRIKCDRKLVQSLVFDAVATFGFSDTCPPPDPTNTESSVLGMYGARFSFISTRSGLTRVRHFDLENQDVKQEALAFASNHARGVDETFYSRTVDFNMLVNETATLIQVPFNLHEKIRDRFQHYSQNLITSGEESESGNNSSLDGSNQIDGGENPPGFASARLDIKNMNLFEKLDILANNSLHAIATQSIVAREGTRATVAGVAGVFYDYASFAMRFFNLTNDRAEERRSKLAACYVPGASSSNPELCDESNIVRCGHLNDTFDCLLVDNNGYIVVSEDLDFVGRHLKSYEPAILARLVEAQVYQAINITDHQAICIRPEEKTAASSAFYLQPNSIRQLASRFALNLFAIVEHLRVLTLGLSTLFSLQSFAQGAQTSSPTRQQLTQQPLWSLLPQKTYLRPCEKVLTLYEMQPNKVVASSEKYGSQCGCGSDLWFVYEQVPSTNLIMIVTDRSECHYGCTDASGYLPKESRVTEELVFDAKDASKGAEELVCSALKRDSQQYRKKLEHCFSHHSEEEHIKLCGGGVAVCPCWRLNLLTGLAIVVWCWLFAHRRVLHEQD